MTPPDDVAEVHGDDEERVQACVVGSRSFHVLARSEPGTVGGNLQSTGLCGNHEPSGGHDIRIQMGRALTHRINWFQH